MGKRSPYRTMRGLEKIVFNKKIIAIVFRANLEVSGVKFLTDVDNPFQVGIHSQKRGVVLEPHVHKIEKPLSMRVIQELLMVQRGKIKVNIFTKGGKFIKSSILSNGDSVLFLDCGHGVEFLEKSRIFMVKQGPYLK